MHSNIRTQLERDLTSPPTPSTVDSVTPVAQLLMTCSDDEAEACSRELEASDESCVDAETDAKTDDSTLRGSSVALLLVAVTAVVVFL